MKLAMTLLVRDEADILDAHLAYHLNAGVDLVIATDHRSVDGTTELLESHAREGHLHLFREDSRWIRQSEWATRMARLAATDHGADWVINSDADEFWWPRGGSLKEVLSAVPAPFGMVRALVRTFLPRPDDGAFFADRMTVRLATPAPINDPATPFRPVAKIVHRGDAGVTVGRGSNFVSGPWPLLHDWYPLEVLHAPLRSREQCARKYEKTWTGWQENLRGDLARAAGEFRREDAGDYFDRVVIDDETLRRGLAAGSLVADTRLSDGLRALRAAQQGLKSGGRRPTAMEEAEHAVEASCFAEAELVRLARRADELGTRLAQLEKRRPMYPSARS